MPIAAGWPALTASRLEELPWHDPALAARRAAGACRGRRPAHVLMAAMAQLDCGQCGYLLRDLCRRRSRSGAEASLSRCVPGGKATSRKLKELLAEIGSPSRRWCRRPCRPPRLGAAACRKPATRHGSPPGCARRRRCIVSGAEKDTRHVVLETPDRDLTYQVGDSLGVVARNCPDSGRRHHRAAGGAAPKRAFNRRTASNARSSRRSATAARSAGHPTRRSRSWPRARPTASESACSRRWPRAIPAPGRTMPICSICSTHFRRRGRRFRS